VALGLLVQDIKVDKIELPVFPFRAVGSHLPKETIQSEFPHWLIGHGLNDCVEALEPLFLEVWRACQIPKLKTEKITEEYVHELQTKLEAEKFARRPVGSKIDAFRSEFPEVLSVEWESTLRAPNKLRVCLTHAGGHVRAKDCTRESSLEVGLLWREFVFVDEEGHEHAVVKGMYTKIGGYLGLRIVRAPKEVQIGERVAVGPAELLGICETLLQFAVELRQSVVEYLRQHGLVPEGFVLDPPQYNVELNLDSSPLKG
jgi:hypothetical protein